MHYTPEQLQSLACDLLRGLRTPKEAASQVATSLVRADRVGYGTHGERGRRDGDADT